MQASPRSVSSRPLRGALAASLALLLVWSGTARADEPAPAPSQAVPTDTSPEPEPEREAAPKPPASPAPAVPAKNGASFDFDLFGDGNKPGHAAPPTSASTRDPIRLEHDVRLRRRMLSVHQGFGFATLVLLAATVVIGQLNYVDKYGGGDFTERYQTPHLALALTSSASFATTGLLALFAPTPYKKPRRADAAMLHKVMMGIATAGMAAELALGFATASKGGELYQKNIALTHLVTGYVTFASMAAGYLAFVF